MLILIGFLIGFVPLYIWHRAFKWRQKRKLSAIERTAPLPAAPAQSPSPLATPISDPAQAD
jgi:hypothetical protein